MSRYSVSKGTCIHRAQPLGWAWSSASPIPMAADPLAARRDAWWASLGTHLLADLLVEDRRERQLSQNCPHRAQTHAARRPAEAGRRAIGVRRAGFRAAGSAPQRERSAARRSCHSAKTDSSGWPVTVNRKVPAAGIPGWSSLSTLDTSMSKHST